MAGGNFGGGNGTAFNPYLVEDAEDLNAVRNHLSSYFVQTQDIDLSSYDNWLTISPTSNFTGYYNGGDFKISNLTINRPSTHQCSLFGRFANCTIKNIVLVNADVIGNSSTAILCSVQDATSSTSRIENIRIEDSRLVGSSAVGLLVGENLATLYIENCHVQGEVKGNVDVGGFIGRALGIGSINRCSSDARVSSDSLSSNLHIGGFVGRVEAYSISNSFSLGSVETITSLNAKVGGFAGRVLGILSTPLTACYSKCSVQSNGHFIGGFVGEALRAGTQTGQAAVFNDCYATGDVEGGERVGGFMGGTSAAVQINRCYSSGNVAGGSMVGGFTGGTTNQTILDSFSLCRLVTRKAGSSSTDFGDFTPNGSTSVTNRALETTEFISL